MYDYRGYLVILSAVFLALAIGLLVGVSYGEDILIYNQQEVIELLENRLLSRDEEINIMKEELQAWDAFREYFWADIYSNVFPADPEISVDIITSGPALGEEIKEIKNRMEKLGIHCRAIALAPELRDHIETLFPAGADNAPAENGADDNNYQNNHNHNHNHNYNYNYNNHNHNYNYNYNNHNHNHNYNNHSDNNHNYNNYKDNKEEKTVSGIDLLMSLLYPGQNRAEGPPGTAPEKTADALKKLESAGKIRTWGDWTRPSDGVNTVLLLKKPTENPPTAFIKEMADRLRDEGLSVIVGFAGYETNQKAAGAEPGYEKPVPLPECYAEWGLSTVEHADTFWGRLAILEIIRTNAGGHYGFQPGSGGLFPGSG